MDVELSNILVGEQLFLRSEIRQRRGKDLALKIKITKNTLLEKTPINKIFIFWLTFIGFL